MENGSLSSQSLTVRAKFPFAGKNNDELCFEKNDIIVVTQKLDGGWWEGTLNGKTGWFPSNFVAPLKETKAARTRSPVGLTQNVELSMPKQDNRIVFRQMILQDLLENEKKHVNELQTLFNAFLTPLKSSKILEEIEFEKLIGNYEEIIDNQLVLLKQCETESKKAIDEQRIGAAFISLAPQFKLLFTAYCSNHPVAVSILTNRRNQLAKFMEGIGSNIMTLTAGLSQPFRHLEKYPVSLQELERNLEESHVDRGDTQRAVSVFRDLCKSCANLRKQKETQLELLATEIAGWEGEPIETLGDIVMMGSAGLINCLGEKEERFLVLFDGVLVVFDVDCKLNTYILKMKLPLKDLSVRRAEPSDVCICGFEISGGSLDIPLIVTFITLSELSRWNEALQTQQGVHFEEPITNVISPIVPSVYQSVQGSLSPLMRPEISTLPSPGQAEMLKKSSTLPPGMGSAAFGPYSMEANSSPAHPYQSKLWTGFSLRPHAVQRGFNSATIPAVKSAVRMRRRGVTGDTEDSEILKTVEFYCASGKSKSVIKSAIYDAPSVLIAEDEKLFIEEMVGDELVVQEKTLVDTVYALKDQVSSLQEELKLLSQRVDKEQKARRRLEELLKRSGFVAKEKFSTPPESKDEKDKAAVGVNNIPG